MINETLPRHDKWIKLYRKALGITIKQLAKRAKVSPSRIVRIEHDEQKKSITLKTLRKMATAMNADLMYAIVPLEKGKE